MTKLSSNTKTMILVLALALVFALATASSDLTVSTTTAAITTTTPDLSSTQQYEAQHASSTSIPSPQHDESHLTPSDLEEVRLRKYDAQFAAFIKEQEQIQQQPNQLSLQSRDLKEEENGK